MKRLVLAAATLGIAASLAAQESSSVDDPPARVARISALSGTVSFQPSGADAWSDATLNYAVTSATRLFTGVSSRAELDVGTLAIRLGDATDLTMTTLTDHLLQLGVAQGIVRVSVYRLAAGDTIELDTPNGAFLVEANGQYRISVDSSRNATRISVDKGRLDAVGPDVSQIFQDGQCAALVGVNPVVLSSVARPVLTSFDAWSASRDRRMLELPSTEYVNADVPGSADLYQYGSWAADATWGAVWYPNAVAPDWVPYRLGRWAWVEPWGWTWVGDEPWGFAPYHYGRWVFIGRRWAWIPGPWNARPCFAPALVVFIGGHGISVAFGADVQGWFPLGPREPYFPWYYHGPVYLRALNASELRDVPNVGVLLGANASAIRYANRDIAPTLVKTSVFNSGAPVGINTLRVAAQIASRAEIMPHPATVPSPLAEFGGRTRTRPVVPSRPPMVSARPPARPVAPTRPPITPRDRPLYVRAQPALQNPPFKDRQKGMQQYPGRPLEPRQIEDVRAGRPVSPPRGRPAPSAPLPKKPS